MARPTPRPPPVTTNDLAECVCSIGSGYFPDLKGPGPLPLPTFPRQTLGTVCVTGHPSRAVGYRGWGAAVGAPSRVCSRLTGQRGCGQAATRPVPARQLWQEVDRWWLHVDLDVLDPDDLPAQGLPDYPDEPGGLTWDQPTEALTAAVARGGCPGVSVAIYDPAQDLDRAGARRIVQFICDIVAELASG